MRPTCRAGPALSWLYPAYSGKALLDLELRHSVRRKSHAGYRRRKRAEHVPRREHVRRQHGRQSVRPVLTVRLQRRLLLHPAQLFLLSEDLSLERLPFLPLDQLLQNLSWYSLFQVWAQLILLSDLTVSVLENPVPDLCLSDQACPEFTEKKLPYLGFRKVDRLRLCLPIHPVYSDLFCERCLGLDRAENTEGTMIQHWTFALNRVLRRLRPASPHPPAKRCKANSWPDRLQGVRSPSHRCASSKAPAWGSSLE